MVKNVRNKIIISVASILLMAAAIVMYPYIESMVEAATDKGSYQWEFEGVYGKDTACIYTVQFDTTELTYSGKEQLPRIDGLVTVKRKDNGSVLDTLSEDDFTLSGAQKNASSTDYKCKISINTSNNPSKLNNFSINSTEELTYSIQKATLLSLDVSYEESSAGITYIDPLTNEAKIHVTKVAAITDHSDLIELPSDGYTVTSVRDTGMKKTFTVNVAETENYNATSIDVQCNVAYDLGNLPAVYKIKMEGSYVTDNGDGTGYADYQNGNSIKPVLKVADSSTGIAYPSQTGLTNIYSNAKSSFTDVGTYTITLKPVVSNGMATINGVWFGGQYTATFKVNGKDADELLVFYDADGDGIPEKIESNSVVLAYDGGGDVKLVPEYIESHSLHDNRGNNLQIQDDCTLIYIADTSGVGLVTLEIIPSSGKAGEFYTGKKIIKYMIKGKMKFTNYNYNKATVEASKSNKLIYNTKVRYIEGGNVVPVSGSYSVTKDSDYKIFYQYQDENGEWLPNTAGLENGWPEAAVITPSSYPSYQADIEKHMANSGLKRAVIVGIGDFSNQVSTHEYEITKVEMKNDSKDGTFTVTCVPDTATYNGSELKPEVSVKFKSKEAGAAEETLEKDVHYKVSYRDNINAGTGIAVITGMGSFEGTIEKAFTINKLIGKLVFLDSPDATSGLDTYSYTYTGEIIKPIFGVQPEVGDLIKLVEGTDYIITDVEGQPLSAIDVNSAGYSFKFELLSEKKNNINLSSFPTIYRIKAASLVAEMFTVENEVWDGTKMPARVSSPKLVEGVDYTVGVPSNSDKPGTATVKITGTGNYTNYVDINYTISPRPINSDGISASATVGDLASGVYPTTVAVTDEDATKSSLVIGTDYQVNVYKIVNGARTAKTVHATAFSLSEAGDYEFEIEGIGNYIGRLNSEELKVSCGYNLADYYVYITNNDTIRKLKYSGASLTPSSSDIKLYKRGGGTTDYSSIINHDFKYHNETTNEDDITTEVGKIRVTAVGKGNAYGETLVLDDEEYAYYYIVPDQWKADKGKDADRYFKVEVEASRTYNTEDCYLPDIDVYYDKAGSVAVDPRYKLKWGEDYIIKLVKTIGTTTQLYDVSSTGELSEALINAGFLNEGEHSFRIIGIGNYADPKNNYLYTYTIDPAVIEDTWIIKDKTVPFITDDVPYRVRINGKGADLVPGVDYKVGKIEDNSDSTKRKYRIETLATSNYVVKDGVIEFEIDIQKMDWKSITVHESYDDCPIGEIYVSWEKPTLIFTETEAADKEHTQLKPKFKLMVRHETYAEELLESNDASTSSAYKIEGYGRNNKAGRDENTNYVQISGTFGFEGTTSIPCTLYNPLTYAVSGTATEATEAARVGLRFGISDDGSLLYPGANVTLANFKAWKDSGELEKVHIKLNFNDGKRATTGGLNLSDADFKAEVITTSNDIGLKTIRLTGTEDSPNYFSGTFDFTVYTTGDLDDATITIGSYGNNEIEYDGQTLTAAKMNLQVVVNKTILHEETDYKVESIVQPTNIGPGTITLSGLGEYKGTTVSADFKVVANLSKNTHLKYEILGSDDNYYEYDAITREKKTYPYKQEVKPEVKVSIEAKDSPGTYLPISQNIPAEGESVAAGLGYYLKYVGNTRATDSESAFIHINPSNDSYLRYSKQMSFVIARTDINAPAISEIGPTNTTPMYTGSPMDPDTDLNFKLTDAANPGVDLVGGVDYELNYNPGINYTDYTGQTIELIVTGKGNYKGTRLVRYTIQQRPMTMDYFVMAQPVEMAYRNAQITADIVGPKIQVVQNGDNILHKNLKYGVDFEIEKFLNLSGSLIDAPKAVGSYKIVLKAKDGSNYTGTQIIDYRITELELTEIDIRLSNCDCTANDGNTVLHCIYNGREHRPAVEVRYQGNSIDSSDYEVTYTNNLDAGTATVTITPASGASNFSGTKSVDFTIYPKSISELIFAPVDAPNHSLEANGIDITPSYEFTGHTVQPGMNVFDEDIKTAANMPTELVNSSDGSKDYKLTYETTNQREEIAAGVETCSYAGKLRVIVEGTGNYTGTRTFNYYIGRNIDQAYPVIQIPLVTYNGLKQEPIITNVERNGVSLADDEYTVVAYKRENNLINKDEPLDYEELTDAAEYVIAVEGVPSRGTYTKNPRQDTTYRILPRSISGAEVSGFEGMYYYTGSDICPRGIIVTDTSLPISLSNLNQTKSVQLISGTDYIVTYKNNRAAGKATIVVEGKGNYSGYVYAYFTIDSSNIAGGDGYDETSDGTGALDGGGYSISPSDIVFTYSTSGNNWMDYTGYSVRPSFTITQNGAAVPSSYFYVTLENSVNPGVATMVIHGDGVNLTGAISKNYLIKADLARYGKIAPIEDQIYTGNQITPAVTVSVGDVVLREGVDYTVTYVNNTNMGTATAYATATVANSTFYYGRLTGSFNISNAAGGMQVVGYASTYAYTGSPITPDIAVTMNGVNLVKDRDYTVTYSNNTNVGTATITVQGRGSYSGTKTITFVIQPKNIENCVASVVQNQSYTGQTYTPVISITDMGTGKTLVSGSDYTLTYSNNTNPGTATITVQALGKNYTGSKVVNFKITSAPVTGLKLVSASNHKVKLGWNKQDYADGYQICNASNRVLGATKSNSITVSGLSSAKTYSFKVRSYVQNADGSVSYGDFSSIVSTKTMLNTPKIKVDARGNGIVTVRWSKVEKATGYEIYYSTTKSGTYYKLATASKSAKRIFNDKGLAKGEVYYYTMRAYRTVNGEKVYSGYSTIQKVKVK